jgi:ribulose-5-phosphate 4-epimerase/fuculose-1-phosphate aldolase
MSPPTSWPGGCDRPDRDRRGGPVRAPARLRGRRLHRRDGCGQRPAPAGLRTLLLANHGPIVAAADLATATDAIEELEETARLFLPLHGHLTRPLTGDQAERLRARAKA